MGSSQVSPTRRQGPEFTSFHKTTTISKTISNMSLIKPSHIERAVKFVSSNSTKLKSETSPIVCSFERREIKSRSLNIRNQTKKIRCKNSHQRIFFRKDFTPQTIVMEG